MNDHNLDDLIIGDPEPITPHSKKLLSLIALVIVILIVGLILWALLFSTPGTEPTVTPSQNQTQTLEPTLPPLEPSPKEPREPTLAPTPTPKPVPTPKPAPTPKPVPKPTGQTTSKAPATAPSTPSVPAGGELIKTADKPIYYIQVGAFKRPPSARFMKKLKEGGFTFITKSSRGIRRVRVGPYDSYAQAKAALPVVKRKLGIDGLIVKY